jgi:transglutaminase-like putative cysteine protease
VSRPSVVRVLAALPVPAVLIGLVALSGVALGRIYDGPLLAQLVFGAAVASVGVGAAAGRAPAWAVAPLSVLAMLCYGAVALNLSARRAGVSGDLASVAVDALRNGVPRLLTAMIPVEPQPDTVAVPLVAAWLAGLAGAELAMRARRVLFGYAPPVLLFAGALYVVGPNARPAIWPTVAFAALAALGLAATGRPHRADPAVVGRPARAALRTRAAAGAAAAVTVVIALSTVLGPALAGGVGVVPVDPRRYVAPPRLDALDENPLIRLSGWALNPDQRLFDLVVRGGDAGSGGAGGEAEITRVRLAVLSDYDGITWRVGATYRSAGRALPGPDDAARPTIRQEITIGDLTGRLLPVVPAPRRVDGVRVAYDPATATLIRPEGLVPGLRYAAASRPEPLDVNLLPAADVPSGPAVARVLRVGEGVPDQLRRLAEQLGTDSGAPYERAVAIEQFLAEHYRLVADAPSGHAYPNLSFFLFGPRNAGGQRGTSEQFAASFAVLGRLLGLPTRVVVGFGVPAGTTEVRGVHALAWPEVLFEGVGWVPFHPLPDPDVRPRPVEEDFRPAPEPSTPPPSEPPPPSASPTGPATPAAAPPVPADGDVVLPATGAGLGALVVLAVAGFALGVPLLRRAQRRRRLDRGDPAGRVAGAWLEVIDALRLAGRPAGAHLAASEVVAHAAAATGRRRFAHAGQPRVRLPAPPLDDLAAVVNLTAFADAATDEAHAHRARAQALAYVAELRARRPWWRRVVWSLHPGPLRWHRHRRTGPRE